ncbi:hypothetical protein RUND412_006924 [Rhizina undulata]
MVSFWPFGRGDANSPDGFERILAKLASQISNQSAKLARLRQSSRRYQGLWTLWTVFAYTVCVLILFFVVGMNELGPQEYGGIFGGPVVIWGVRRLLDFHYERRISSIESTLHDLQTQQRDTIEKLKAATKFSTTQSLIEKYGGGGAAVTSGVSTPRGPGGPGAPGSMERKRLPQQSPNQPMRPRPDGPVPTTPQQIQAQLAQQQLLAQQRAGIPPQAGSPQMPGPVLQPQGPAPHHQRPPPILNIQPSSQQLLQPEEASPKWYDRILDLIVGEDETSAKNRYALICRQCRMVNGLAPPGIRSLDEMEGWGCARCLAWNGSERRAPSSAPSAAPSVGSESEVKIKDEDSESGYDTPVKEEGRRKQRKVEANGRTTRSRSKAMREREVSEEQEEEESVEEEEEEEEKTPRRRRGKGRGRK